MFCLRFLADSAKVKLISSFQVFLEEKFHFTLWYSQMYFAFYAYNIFPVENVIASLRLPIMMRSSWWAYKNRENACPPGRELIDHTCTFTFWRNFFFCEFQSLSFSPFSNRFKNSIFHQKSQKFPKLHFCCCHWTILTSVCLKAFHYYASEISKYLMIGQMQRIYD